MKKYYFVKGNFYPVIWNANKEFLLEFSEFSGLDGDYIITDISRYQGVNIEVILLEDNEFEELIKLSKIKTPDPVLKNLYKDLVYKILKI